MAQPGRVGDLEISQDVPHMRLEWKIERVAWVVMALVLLSALAGLLGPGPLSSTTAGRAGSALWVEYNRFERHQAPAAMRVHIGPQTESDGVARLWLLRDYVESIQVEHIDPEPESVEVTPDRFIYTFQRSGADRPATVIFYFEGHRFWRQPVSMGLEGGPGLEFTQLFYP